VLPAQAFPVIRPRCCLRYLTFFGINIESALRGRRLALAHAYS
jgi:hypothetical protein